MSNDRCDLNDAQVNVVVDPLKAIEVEGGKNIKVDKQSLTDKTIFTVNYQEYAKATIDSNTAIHKVGTTVPSFTFNVAIIPGSENLVSRAMIPDKGLNLEEPFSWTEENILGTDSGLWPKYDGSPTIVSCMDDTGVTVSKEIGLEYRYLFYMGYSIKDNLTESDIKALATSDLLTNIKSKYSSFTYNYTVLPAYIYWVFPEGTPSFSEAAEGPLPVPLKLDLPNVNITDEGITKSYRVIRTAVRTRFNNAKLTIQ